MKLPVDLDIERMVLGAVLVDDSCFHDVAAALEPDDFSLEAHRRIWAAMAQLREDGEAIDRVTVYAQLQRVGHAESVGGLSYLASMDDGLPHVYALDGYLRELRRLGQCRRAIRVLAATAKEISEFRTPEALGRAEEVIRGLGAGSASKIELRRFGSFLEAFPGGIEEFTRPSKHRGIPLPWPSINDWYGGLLPGKLVILAARTSVGKSLAGVQIAHYAATMGAGTAIFSLEMSAEQNWARIITQRTAAHRGTAPQAWVGAMHAVADLPLYLCEKTKATVPAIRAVVERLQRQQKVSLVVVDYLQLLSATGRSSNRQEAVAEISRGLKVASQESGAAWLVLAQLNRQAEEEGAEPKLSHLRESGAIEQDADDVLFLHMTPGDRRALREQGGLLPHEREPVPIKVIVAKQRDGEVGSRTLRFDPRSLTIAE